MRVCVFCASSMGNDPRFAEAAREVGELLGKRGLGLVYGGANVGLMGVVADAALAAGAEVIGILPRLLEDKEVAHRGLTQLLLTDGMHERKAKMYELADVFPHAAGRLRHDGRAVRDAHVGAARRARKAGFQWACST